MKQFEIYKSFLVLALVGATLPGSALAGVPVIVDDAATKIELGLHVEYLEDKGATLLLDDVLKPEIRKRFKVSEVEVPSFGFTASAYWFAFELQHQGNKPIERLLQLNYHFLDWVDVYILHADGEIEKFRTGDNLPFSQRPLNHRSFVFPLELGAQSTVRVFLRVQTSGNVQLPLTLWGRDAFFESSQESLMVQGVYFGIMLVMALYNLFIFITLRQRSYLYYVFFVISTAGFQGTVQGLSFQYLWPENVWWAQKNVPFFLGVIVVFGALFTLKFLRLKTSLPRLYRLLTIVVGIGGLLAIASFLLPYVVVIRLAAFTVILGCACCFLCGVVGWKQGMVEARYYTIAWVSLILGSISMGLSRFGILPANFFTQNGLQLGSAFEVILLSLALAHQLKSLQEENLRIQKGAAEELQGKVAVATSELRGQAEKLKELDKQKTVFFQNISHELRTPLTLILNPLESLLKKLPDDKEVDVAAKNSRRLLRLVNQLLDFQKLEAGKHELKLVPLDFSRFMNICGGYFASVCSSKDVKFSMSFNGEVMSEKPPPVNILGEVDALEKVTFNFLSNALKYTPAGGEIELGLTTTSDQARIFVRDTGPGISDEGKKKLFQVFSQVDETATRDYEGTGLGLALVKSLADEMMGEVGIESEVGKGSTFWAEFPIINTPTSVVDVLLVEDDELTLMSLAEVLESCENIKTCKLAKNAEEAREILKNHTVKCIVSDETMPGENGIDFLSFVADSLPLTRRILETGLASEELLSKAINSAQVDHVFIKPFNILEFRVVVDGLVRTSAIADAVLEEGEDFKVKDWLLADAGGQTGLEDTGTFLGSDEVEEGSGELVLVVDDLRDMRDLISDCLKKGNYRVARAPNGKRGLEVARESKPDLIVTDWMMPQMSGPELIEAIREDDELTGTPIVLLTAKSDEESKLIGTEIGADAFLGKPFSDQELMSTVRNLMGLKFHQKRAVEALKNLQDAQEILIESEKMSALGVLVAGVAHEMNTPLAAIQMASETIELSVRGLKLDEVEWVSRFNKLAFINSDSIKQLARIVESLRLYGHPDSEEPEIIAIREMLERTLTIVRSGLGNVPVEIVCDENLKFPVFPSKVAQVLNNLLVNAAHACNEQENPQIKVSVLQKNGALRIGVEDNGTGIPEELKRKIFDPFFTTKPAGKGTGLGLALCKRFAEEMSGSLEVSDEKGGATFYLTLPAE